VSVLLTTQLRRVLLNHPFNEFPRSPRLILEQQKPWIMRETLSRKTSSPWPVLEPTLLLTLTWATDSVSSMGSICEIILKTWRKPKAQSDLVCRHRRSYQDRSQSLVCIRMQTGQLIDQCVCVGSCRDSELNSTIATSITLMCNSTAVTGMWYGYILQAKANQI